MKKLFNSKKGFNFQGHLTIGLIVIAVLFLINNYFGLIAVPTDPASIIKFVGIAIVYSLAPDIDQPGSIINKWVTVGLVGLIIWAFFYNKLAYGVVAAVVLGLLRLIEHRTILHSVIGGAVVAAPLLYFGLVFFLVGLIAFVTHIIADDDFSWGWEKDKRHGLFG